MHYSICTIPNHLVALHLNFAKVRLTLAILRDVTCVVLIKFSFCNYAVIFFSRSQHNGREYSDKMEQGDKVI